MQPSRGLVLVEAGSPVPNRARSEGLAPALVVYPVRAPRDCPLPHRGARRFRLGDHYDLIDNPW